MLESTCNDINLEEDVELQEYKHQNRERLCYYTNELYNESEIIKYTIRNRGYGSIFDGDGFTIQINKYVAKALENDGLLRAEWFDNEAMIVLDSGFIDYKHEDDIYKFIKDLIIENREYIENCENYLIGKIDRYDWIKDEYKSAMINNNQEEVEDDFKDCDFCKELLDYVELYDIPWCEEGIWCSYYNYFYLIPQQDGEQEHALRPHIEIEYCPKCGRKL